MVNADKFKPDKSEKTDIFTLFYIIISSKH